MAEGFINFTEGSGKKLRTFNRTIGANSVEEQFVNLGAQSLATYSALGGGLTTTANSHQLQIMAGAALNVRIHRIRIYQTVNVTTLAFYVFEVWRLTTAGTGGTVVTPSKFDNGDAASGATAMTLPTVKGTEGAQLDSLAFPLVAATTAGQPSPIWEWNQSVIGKPYIIPAGTANGIVVKNVTNAAAGQCKVVIEFTETSYL